LWASAPAQLFALQIDDPQGLKPRCFGILLGTTEEAAEKLSVIGFSRAEARETKRKQRTSFGTAKAVPFQNPREFESFRSL